jgi:hypothetical protein
MIGYKLSPDEFLEMKKCMDDPIYFIETYCKIISVDHGIIPFKLFPKQRQMVKNFVKNRFNIVLASRQFGKTACVAAWMVWLLVFNDNFLIACLADKMDHAQNIVTTVKLMIEYLPIFLKPVDGNGNLPEDNKRSITLTNGSRVFGAPTTAGSIRGESINLCISGNSEIFIRNKKTGIIEKITINELKERLRKGKKNSDYEILTPNGWSNFSGILETKHNTSINIVFENGKSLEGSLNHKIKTKNGFVSLNEINIGDEIEIINNEFTKIVEKNEIRKESLLYDILNVDEDNEFYANDVLNHNCYIDEFAIVPQNLANDFMNNAYPTITSGKTTKLCITSTPKGLNHFWSIWNKAERGKNEYVPLRIDWWERPDRDDKWKDEQVKNLGETSFNQEFGNMFLGSALTLVDYRILESIHPEEPYDIRYDDYFRIYKEPHPDGVYVMGIDLAKVVNKDYHAVQIIKIDKLPFEQVAVFHTNKLSYRIIDEYIARIGELYNNAWIIIERNDICQSVADRLWYGHGYENLIWDPFANKPEPGILTTKKTKKMYLQLVKDYVDGRLITLYDEETIKELSHFVLLSGNTDNAKYGPENEGGHDDLIMSLALSLFFILTPYYVGQIDGDQDGKSIHLFREIQDMMPPGLFFGGKHKSSEELKKEFLEGEKPSGLIYRDYHSGEREDSRNIKEKFNERVENHKRPGYNVNVINTDKWKEIYGN